jgi:hypothetical protein
MSDGIKKYIYNKTTSVLLLLAMYLCLISHLGACIFMIMEREALADSDSSGGHAPNKSYITVIYFLITSQTSVGYGDVTIDHLSIKLVFVRYFYQIVLMLFSIIFNGIFFSLILTVTADAANLLNSAKFEVK